MPIPEEAGVAFESFVLVRYIPQQKCLKKLMGSFVNYYDILSHS